MALPLPENHCTKVFQTKIYGLGVIWSLGLFSTMSFVLSGLFKVKVGKGIFLKDWKYQLRVHVIINMMMKLLVAIMMQGKKMIYTNLSKRTWSTLKTGIPNYKLLIPESFQHEKKKILVEANVNQKSQFTCIISCMKRKKKN